MKYIQGISSNQLKIFKLEDEISRDKIESFNREFTLVLKCEGKHAKKSFSALKKKRIINPLNMLSNKYMITPSLAELKLVLPIKIWTSCSTRVYFTYFLFYSGVQ
jgi:hypothetical protein